MMEKIQLFALTAEMKKSLDCAAKRRNVSQGAICRLALKKLLEESR